MVKTKTPRVKARPWYLGVYTLLGLGANWVQKEAYFSCFLPFWGKRENGYKILEPLEIPVKRLVRLTRFELVAYCLEGSCSIQLSYRRILFEKRGS